MGRRWTCGKAGRSVKGGRVGAVRNGGGVEDGCTKGARTPDMPLASMGDGVMSDEFDWQEPGARST